MTDREVQEKIIEYVHIVTGVVISKAQANHLRSVVRRLLKEKPKEEKLDVVQEVLEETKQFLTDAGYGEKYKGMPYFDFHRRYGLNPGEERTIVELIEQGLERRILKKLGGTK